MSRVRLLRRSAKLLHELASMGFAGGLVACLVINLTAKRDSVGDFMAARLIYGLIASYVLVPSMAVVVVSGLIALAATRAFLDSGWAWLKALLGLIVFEATLVVVGSSRHAVERAAASSDFGVLDGLLRAERNTLLLLMAVSAVNVVLAIWRPRLVYEVR